MNRLAVFFFAAALAGSLGCNRAEELVEGASEAVNQLGEMAEAAVEAVAPRPSGTSLEDLVANVPGDVVQVIYVDVHGLLAATAEVSNSSVDELRQTAQSQVAALASDTPEMANFDITQLHSAAIVTWPEANDDDNVLFVTQPGVWRAAPAEGAAAVAFSEAKDEPHMVVRDGRLYIGESDSPAFMAVVAGVAEADRFSGAATWSEGWTSATRDSLMSVFVADAATAADTWDVDTAQRQQLTDAGVTRFAMNITDGGAATATVDIRDETVLMNALGNAQWAFDQLMLQARPLAIPVAQGWIAYIDLVNKAAWSRLSVARTGTVTTLSLPAPTCGTAISYMLLGGLYAGLAAEGDAPPQPQPYRPITQRIADNCDALPGPAPSIPVNHTNLAGDTVQRQSALVLLDFAALLRQGLPTMFGTLPFALHPDDINAAFGATPMGLAGLNDANGDISFAYAEGAAGPIGTIVMPPGTFGMLPIPPSPEVVNQRIEGVGYVFGTPGAEQRVVAPRNNASPWSEIVDAMPAASIFGGAMDASILDEVYSSELPKPAALNGVTLVGLSMAADFQPVLYFHSPSGGAGLEGALRAEVERMGNAMIAEASREMGPSATAMTGYYTEALEKIEISSAGNVAMVSYGEQLFTSGTVATLAGVAFAAAVLAEIGDGDAPPMYGDPAPPLPAVGNGGGMGGNVVPTTPSGQPGKP